MLAGIALSRREDPAEDVAIGNIMTTAGNYRVFLGNSSDQAIVHKMFSMPTEDACGVRFSPRRCHSLLKLSDLLVERRAYVRIRVRRE